MKNIVNRALVAKKKQFLSKSVPRGTRTIWRYLGALFILFTFAIGNVWADYSSLNYDGANAFPTGYTYPMNGDVPKNVVLGSAASGLSTGGYFININSGGNASVDGTNGGFTTGNGRWMKFTVTENCNLVIKFYSGSAGRSLNLCEANGFKSEPTALATRTIVNETGNDERNKNVELSYSFTGITTSKDFYLYGRGGSNVYITKITFTAAASCTADPTAPTKFEAGSITTDGVTFTITDDANAGKYDIYYSTSSTAPVAATAASATSTAKTKEITGLTASTKYYAWVRSVCDDTHKSAWTALEGGSFTTLSGPRDLYKINMTSTSETNMSHGQKVELTSTYGTVTGGYADLYNKHASDDSKLKVNSNGISISGNDPCVILYLNEPLHVGDKIEFTSSVSKEIKIGVADDKDVTLATTSSKSYTVASEGLAGKQVIYLWRVSSTTYIKTLTISTTAELPTFRTVTFDPNYTSATNITRTVADGAKVVYIPKDPENGTQEFLGWFEGSAASAFDFSTAITADKTLTAHWSAPVVKHTISFNTDGGTSVESIEVVDGQAATAPTAPKKAGYEFDKWYNGEAVYDWSAAVTGDLTLTAHWNKVYVAQGTSYVFEDNGTLGTAPNAISVTKDNQPNAIAANSRIDNMWLSAMSVKLENGTYSGSGDDFKGWKINTASATIKFFVENDSRVTVTVGNLSSGLNITYTGKSATEAATTALTAKAANPYDVKGGTLVTLTTGGGSTVTLKGIAVSAIPALDDDATLSDLKVGGVTVAGFSANTHTYYYELPYGTAVGDIPAISATANSAKAKQVAIEQAVWTGDPYNCYRAQANVQAEDESWGYYDVQFSFAPKYGVELIKATHDGTASGATITGYIGGQKDKDTYANGKLGEIGKYFGIKLADGNFQAGDLVEVKVSMFEGGNTATMFTDKGETPLSSGAFDVNNKVYRFTLTAETEWIYIYRKDGTCNPRVQSIAVYRQMNPFIEEFKIGEAVGTITGTNIAIELPYGTSLYGVAATIEAYANGGATVIAPTPLAYDTPLGYKVSSAYVEDGDVDYTVTITEAEHYEAMIVGGANYETLAAAVAAAQADDVVKLLDNVDLMATGLTIAENITLDLNGFNIKAGEQIDNDIVVPAGKKLTLVDNSANAEGKIYTEQAYTGAVTGYGLIRVAGELLMQSGNIYAVIDSDPANLGQFAVVIAAGGKVTVEGGQIKAGWYAISNNGNNTGSTIIVSGGELISTADFAIYNPAKESTVTVSGGVVYGAAGGIAMNRGELTVTGGTITSKDQGTTGTWGDGTGGLSNAAISASGKYESVNVEISGGTIVAEGTAVMITNGTTNPVEIAISGGQFSHVVPAEYCAEGFAPVTTPNAQGKYEVIAAGVIRGAAVQDAEDVYYYTLDNGVTIYSSQSDGRLNTSNHIATSGDIEPCGGDHGGYNVNQSKFVLKFPVNVKEFTLYGANSTERSISKVYDNAEASKDIKISTVGRELTGTYTNTKDGKCQTLTAAFNDENIIPANYYVLVTLSGTANIYRVLYTEAECTTPTVTIADQTAKDGVAVTLTAEASALGATYQWYTCDDAQGTNPVIIPSETAKTLSVTKSGADDQFYKVVVGCNCSAETAEDVAKVSLYTEVTTLVDVTENTVWDWSTIVNDVDGAAITSDGKKVNGANGILANYIQGTNMDKVESNNGAYAIRSNSNQYYQGASLHMHTTKGGILKIHARSDGNTMTLNVQNAGRDIEIGSLGNWKDYTIYVQAGDVVIYNVPETAGKPMRIDQMTFTVKETPDYTRNVSNNYGTLCVEHNVLVGGAPGATFYQIASRNEDYDYKIDFEEVLPNEELKAGEPYLFKSNTGRIDLFYGAETAPTPKPVRGMIGNYEATTLAITAQNKNTIYYFAQNKLWLCDNLEGSNLILNEHRAYINLTQVPTYAEYEASKQQQNSAPRRRVSLEMNGEKIATGCENLNVSDKPVKMIINGQLFILRGEKMYDAKGQLVK